MPMLYGRSPVFFVIKGYRKKGIASGMLSRALDEIKKAGINFAEAYPSKPDNEGKYIDTFAYTGTQSLFSKAGFYIAGNAEGGKQRVRKILNNN